MRQILLTSLLIFIPVLANAETVEIEGVWYNLFPDGHVAQVTKKPSDDIYTESYSGKEAINEDEKVINKIMSFA